MLIMARDVTADLAHTCECTLLAICLRLLASNDTLCVSFDLISHAEDKSVAARESIDCAPCNKYPCIARHSKLLVVAGTVSQQMDYIYGNQNSLCNSVRTRWASSNTGS